MIGSTSALILGGLGAAGSLAGGLIGKGGADAAAAGAAGASREALAAAQQQRKENRSDASPWTSTGTNAIGQIGALLGYGALWNRGGDGATYNYETDPEAFGRASGQLNNFLSQYPGYSPTFKEDPGYAFRLSEGNKALDRSAASKGMLLSGSQVKAGSDFNQGLASQEYGNWWNRSNSQFNNALGVIQNAAGLGAQVQGNLMGANSNLTNQGNNALMGGAELAGKAGMAGSNALASGIGSGINNLFTAGALGGWFGGGRSSYPNPGPTGAASWNLWGRV